MCAPGPCRLYRNNVDSPVEARNTLCRHVYDNQESKPKFGSFKRKKNNTDKIEVITESPIKFKELEGVPTLGEMEAMEAKESA